MMRDMQNMDVRKNVGEKVKNVLKRLKMVT